MDSYSLFVAVNFKFLLSLICSVNLLEIIHTPYNLQQYYVSLQDFFGHSVQNKMLFLCEGKKHKNKCNSILPEGGEGGGER